MREVGSGEGCTFCRNNFVVINVFIVVGGLTVLLV